MYSLVPLASLEYALVPELSDSFKPVRVLSFMTNDM